LWLLYRRCGQGAVTVGAGVDFSEDARGETGDNDESDGSGVDIQVCLFNVEDKYALSVKRCKGT
jgi:hypothetical protein